MLKKQYMSACAFTVLAMGLATPASAQTADAAAPTSAAAQETDQAGSANDDIVVTAQGRAQALADVPLAVTAINASSMERTGASDIRQLAQIAPSLQVSSTGNEANGSARLRGIGTVGDNPGLESSVAVFVDGVYRSRSGIGLNELGDIERVEVLRGPQGTLFGRNASAGIISIVSKSPSFDRFSAGAEASYGNYDYYRLGGNVNVPLGETLAARIDGVYVNRDGFYKDVTNGTKINNRDRYFVRGQLLFEPSSDLKVRLIGDYTKRNENCCTAVYIDQTVAPANRGLLTTANPIIPVLRALGQPTAAFSDPYSRNVYLTPGRSYGGETKDWGVSGQIDYDFGAAQLTSITAYRDYGNYQASDTDYSYVDILYRAPGKDAGFRGFKTFSQELRLQGSAFGEHLDWLVGAFYGDEKLEVRDNLRFGSQYGRFAACRIINGGGLAFAFDPTASGCIRTSLRPVVSGAFGAAGPSILAGFDRLDQVRNVGETQSAYRQSSKNFAFFTHNIITIVDELKLTVGLRYTNETKKLDASFGNDNIYCPAQQAALTPFLTNAGLAAVAGGLISLTCQGNSTSELNGASINSERKEDEFTGTAILSYKVTPDLLIYGSYARGYKGGGFNLDRSALKAPILPIAGIPTTTFAAAGGPQALVGNLQFDQEINNALEIGAKYSSGPFSLNVAAFRQKFKNFQLNTFNGSVFLVQNVNSCSTDLAGADRDLSAATGACASKDVRSGVISQGVEVEASINPARNFNVTAGFTYSDTHFRKNLVGNAKGSALDPALRLLPGDNLSNAPEIVVTSSVSWTPELGSSGLSALFYVDGRLSSDYNSGSDLFPQKEQDSFFVMNARVGIRGPSSKWAVEFWAQNLLNTDYTQVAFSSPFQAGSGVGVTPGFPAASYPGGTQTFSAFLAEPRTYGVTLRGKF
ncbi:TonB-dependent receptor [Sphingomonas sp. So64.6b]|uniref:TonB-dependent receptor n=1 Tax=Sphingomonas sp. So64.6b TaxID=2997354 RepID=UPI0016015BD6|nr:TonB-dependent receptor [Sphingomonas sp. So64.6b]QNA83345.1 TonB-dependent receptor [Sphingomonas sp. So64.6b]